MRTLLLLVLILEISREAPAEELLRLVGQIPMPDVSGRIDHFAQDSRGKRLFVAALGNDTVEVIDLVQGRVVKSITDLNELQGLAWLPSENRLVIAEGEGDAIDAVDGTTYVRTHRLAAEDADNVRVDLASGLVYIGSGSGHSSELVVIDPQGMTVQRRISLPAHPEAFALEGHGARIFVNVPGDRSIVIVDRSSGAMVARWAITGAHANFPMALDESRRRLFVGCRSPARLLIFDTQAGTLLGRPPALPMRMTSTSMPRPSASMSPAERGSLRSWTVAITPRCSGRSKPRRAPAPAGSTRCRGGSTSPAHIAFSMMPRSASMSASPEVGDW